MLSSVLAILYLLEKTLDYKDSKMARGREQESLSFVAR